MCYNCNTLRERLLFVKLRNIAGIFIVSLCVVGLFQLCPFALSTSSSKDVTMGKQAMQQLAKQDINEINSQIQTIQDKFTLQSVDVGSFSARFANTVIMGDSLAAGLIEYGIMPANLVMAERGNRTNNINEDIDRVIGYAPKAIFMEYGINDLGYCRGNAKLFASQYKEQVSKLKKALPRTKIYINSLTPIAIWAQEKNQVYTYVDEFNEALQQMCKELDVSYIDNTKLINFNGDVYEFDGVHPHYPYYPIWLEHMLETAGY